MIVTWAGLVDRVSGRLPRERDEDAPRVHQIEAGSDHGVSWKSKVRKQRGKVPGPSNGDP